MAVASVATLLLYVVYCFAWFELVKISLYHPCGLLLLTGWKSNYLVVSIAVASVARLLLYVDYCLAWFELVEIVLYHSCVLLLLTSWKSN